MASNIEENTDTIDRGGTLMHDMNDAIADANARPEAAISTDTEQWSKGRAAALIMAAALSGVSIVLAASYSVARDHEYGITLKPLYVWEIILYTIAILAMVIFTYLRNNTDFVVDTLKPFSDAYTDFLFDSCNHSNRHNENGYKLPVWACIPLRGIGLFVCCVGAIVLPIHEMYRSLVNMQCFEIRFISYHVLNAVSKCCCVVFCLCQTIFLLRFKTKSSRSIPLKLFMSTIVAANLTLCVNVVRNIKMAEDTLDIKTELAHTNLEERPLFVTCEGNRTKVDYVAEWIYRFSYQFPIEFMVLSLCYFGAIWNVLSHGRHDIVSRTNEENTTSVPLSLVAVDTTKTENLRLQRSTSESSPLIQPTRRSVRSMLLIAIKGTGVFLSTCTFPIAFILIGTIFGVILYNEIDYMATMKDIDILRYNRSSNTTQMKNYYAVVQTIYHYSFCVIAPAAWLLAARKERITNARLNANDILLLVATSGHIIFVMFETVDFSDVVFDKRADTIAIIFFVKMILKYQGILGEAIVVWTASKMEITRESINNTRQIVIRIVVVFLGVFNMERWFTDNFLPPNVIRYVENISYREMYGEKMWWILTAYLYPFVIIFRVAMVTMCYETCVRIKRETLKATSNCVIQSIGDISQ